MLQTVAFAIVYSDVPGLPAGTTVGSQAIEITKPDGTTDNVPVSTGATSASYSPSAAGSYTASLQALDENGAALGSPVNATFSIMDTGTGGGGTGTTVTLSLPSSLTATAS